MSENRRVLHLLSQRPGWTGSGTALHAIAREAGLRGWTQLAVVGTPPADPTPTVTGLDSQQVRPLVFDSESLPFALPGMSDVMPYPSSRFSQLTAAQLAAYRTAWRERIAAAVDEFCPDVIHSHHIWLMSALVKEVAPEVPVVAHCHGTGLRQLALCPHLAEEVRIGVARNDAFLALHRSHAETLIDQLGVSEQRVHVVGSGFRDDMFHAVGRPGDCGPVITYAGKLSNAKGVPWLLEAVKSLRQEFPDVVLNIAGAGSGVEADAIRDCIAGTEHIVFHGQLNQSELADLMRKSAVFVLPSFYEGLPLVLVEATACGCRIVATELPGVVDELQPQLGDCLQLAPLPRLVNQDCPVQQDLPAFVDSLTQAIKLSLSRPPIGDPSSLVQGMTWTAVFERIERVWREVAFT